MNECVDGDSIEVMLKFSFFYITHSKSKYYVIQLRKVQVDEWEYTLYFLRDLDEIRKHKRT